MGTNTLPITTVKFGVFAATCALAISAATSVARADTFVLNVEAPGVQNTTAKFDVVGVETFNEQPVGVGPGFTTDFGTSGAITGAYSGPDGVQINAADQYGGAGGVGNYIVAFPDSPYTINLSSNPTKDPEGINYFGYWLSSLDPGNIVTFYDDGTEVGQVTPDDVAAITSLNKAYYGNPNANFLGKNSGEAYVFINFYDTTGTFNQITFTEGNSYGGGYESDNDTVGFYTGMAVIPETSTWIMMLLGFAALGFARHRANSNVRSRKGMPCVTLLETALLAEKISLLSARNLPVKGLKISS